MRIFAGRIFEIALGIGKFVLPEEDVAHGEIRFRMVWIRAQNFREQAMCLI